MKDRTPGYKAHPTGETGRVACVHGDVCLKIYNKVGFILSSSCPYRCEYYEPLKTRSKRK